MIDLIVIDYMIINHFHNRILPKEISGSFHRLILVLYEPIYYTADIQTTNVYSRHTSDSRPPLAGRNCRHLFTTTAERPQAYISESHFDRTIYTCHYYNLFGRENHTSIIRPILTTTAISSAEKDEE